MQTNRRAVLRPALLVLAGVAIGAAARPAAGIASDSPPMHRFVIFYPNEVANNRRVYERLRTCTHVAMSTIRDAAGEKLAVLCRQ